MNQELSPRLLVLASLRKNSLLGKRRHLSLLFKNAECLPALSIVAGVCHGGVWPWSCLACMAANAACPASSREQWDKGSTKGADFTAAHFDGLFSEACIVWDDAGLVGQGLSFPCWLDKPMFSRLTSWWSCRGLGLLLNTEQWTKFPTELMPVWDEYGNLEVEWFGEV